MGKLFKSIEEAEMTFQYNKNLIIYYQNKISDLEKKYEDLKKLNDYLSSKIVYSKKT